MVWPKKASPRINKNHHKIIVLVKGARVNDKLIKLFLMK